MKQENKNLPFYVSFSEIRTFQECPMKHFLQKVLQVEEDKNDSLIYGSALHASLEQIAKEKVYDKKSWKDIAIKSLIAETSSSYIQGYFGKKLITECTNSLLAFDFWERFKDYEIISIEELMFEPLVEVEGIPIYFKGLNDLGIKHKESQRLKIVDFKSCNKPWDIKKKEQDKKLFWQLVLYKHFFSKKNNIDFDLIDCSFVSLPREESSRIQEHPVEITKEYRNLVLKEVSKVAKEILYMDPTTRAKSKLTGGSACYYCEHNAATKKKGLCDGTPNQIISITQVPNAK